MSKFKIFNNVILLGKNYKNFSSDKFQAIKNNTALLCSYEISGFSEIDELEFTNRSYENNNEKSQPKNCPKANQHDKELVEKAIDILGSIFETNYDFESPE